MKRALRGLARAIGGGLRAVRRSPLEQAVAVGTIALALLLAFGLRLVGANVARVASTWGRGVHMTVYLEPEVAPERAEEIAAVLARFPEVAKVERVSPAQAYQRLSRALGDRADLLDGVEEDLLPATLEVQLREGVAQVERMHPAFEKLRRLPGVEDVDAMGDWVERVAAIERLVRGVGLLLGLLVSAACLYIVASTIRLGVFARREEIEILQLVGATDGFVKAPFLVEGTLQGAAGASLALAALYALFRACAPWVEHTLGGALSAGPITFLAPLDVAGAVAIGAALGLIGSAFAVGRHVRA
jgi:cell division transport system permease protein